MHDQSKKFAFEIGMIKPSLAGHPLYTYTILKLKPTTALFHGYGGDVQEARDTAKAHIAFLKAHEDMRKDLAKTTHTGRAI
jgi:hypothetical protein